ncbi:motile sperm domain-containing protein 2-like isoform X2 [Amphibalanus amphitrite]|uniref:motile sperm domain-containing protein 2-like isoform X2 n=1 Tax=Amphibalanus amphitrite TaxID=1232801 RepID=UPI001C915C31|nr:motile sperm domain-containing protein 2-like isoform X2 [Amphibalanus amphitrite]
MTGPVIYSVSDVSDSQAAALRRRFLEAVEKEEVRDHVHPQDIVRARTDDLWCKRFMAHGDLEIDKAFDFMMDSVKFRHEWQVNELTHDSVVTEFFERGTLSVHGRDRDGAALMIFHSCLHERTHGERFERVKQFLVYWVEKIEREERGQRISLILDMGNAGLSNVDIPFIGFLINLFKLYYPDMLNSIIVFEMPWIMNAAWKIIKQMLPPKSHQLIKFVNKKDIGTVIPPEHTLVRWGGKDPWSYTYRQEDCEMPPSPFLGQQESAGSGDTDTVSADSGSSREQPSPPPGAGGADDGRQGSRGAEEASDQPPEAPVRRRTAGRRATPPPSGTQRAPLSHSSLLHYRSVVDIAGSAAQRRAKDLSDDSGASCDETSDQSLPGGEEMTAEIGDLLKISPGDEIQFATDAVEARRPLMLKNIHRTPVAFKVKITAPEKFRVRPSCGVVAPGRRVTVELRLAPGVAAQQAVCEKFLLVAAPVQPQQVAAGDMDTIWRTLPAEVRLERRLRCAPAPERPLLTLVRGLGQQLESVSQRLARQQALSQQVARHGAATHRWLVLTLFIVAALALCNAYLLYKSSGVCDLTQADIIGTPFTVPGLSSYRR